MPEASWISSGTPLGILPITIGGVDLLGGGDAQRVNVTCNPNLGHFDKTSAKFFNASCISMPGKGDIGNASKDTVRGPGRSNLDTTLFRNFSLGSEKRVLTFRWEVYNTFNHTQFNAIDTERPSHDDRSWLTAGDQVRTFGEGALTTVRLRQIPRSASRCIHRLW